MVLTVLKHDSKKDTAEKLSEETLYTLDMEHDWSMSLKPYFIFKDVMYFTCFRNIFDDNKMDNSRTEIKIM